MLATIRVQAKPILLSKTLPYSDTTIMHNEQIFSTDNNIKKNIQIYFSEMGLYNNSMSSEDMIFANLDGKVLKGDYLFLVNIYEK